MTYSQIIDSVITVKHNNSILFAMDLKNDIENRFFNEENFNSVDFYIYHKDIQKHNYNNAIAKAIQDRYNNDVVYFDSITKIEYTNLYDLAIETVNSARREMWETLRRDLVTRYGKYIKTTSRANGAAKYKDETKKEELHYTKKYSCKNIVILNSNNSYNRYDLRNFFETTLSYLRIAFIKTIRFNRLEMSNEQTIDLFNGLYLYAMERYEKSLNIDCKYFGKFENFNHAFFYSLRILKILSVKLQILDVETLVNYLIYPHKRKALKVQYNAEALKSVADKMHTLSRIECRLDYNKMIENIAYYFTSKYMLEIVNNYSMVNCKDVYKKAVSRLLDKYGKIYNVSFNVLSKSLKCDVLYDIYKQCRRNEHIQKTM